MIETRNCSVALLDTTGELLKTAKNRTRKDKLGERIEVLRGDIQSVPHPDMSFDFVLSGAGYLQENP